MKKNNKKKEMWDLMIPLLLVISVLPFLVRLVVYNCGLGHYSWFGEEIISDFYCYWKSYFFDIIAFFAMGIFALFGMIYRDRLRDMKLFIPLFGYVFFVVLSTFFSENIKASVQGNFESFESCFVLIGYVILALYGYEMIRKQLDYKVLWGGLLFTVCVFFIIGVFQISGHDLLSFEWVKRLVMNGEQYEMYKDSIIDTLKSGQVYLSLYNPNYAGVVLSMFFAIFVIFTVGANTKKSRMGYGVISTLLLVLTWFTHARAALFVEGLVLLFIMIKVGKEHIKYAFYVVGIITVVTTVLVVGDLTVNNGGMLQRFKEKQNRIPLEGLYTGEDGIHIKYQKEAFTLYEENGKLMCKKDATARVLQAEAFEEMKLPMGEVMKATLISTEDSSILLSILDQTLLFLKKDGTYYYQANEDDLVSMKEVPKVSFYGFENFASARGYIWSRVLPLLPRYIFIGSGPDTFVEVFPQEDYAGKIVYADDVNRIIEKSHNDYLGKWVQTGFLSLLCLVVFYVLFVCKLWKEFWSIKPDTIEQKMRMGSFMACLCYMITAFVNDSTLQTAPFFWVFVGIALSKSEALD